MGSCASKKRPDNDKIDLESEIKELKEQIQQLIQRDAAKAVHKDMITKDEFNDLKQKFEKLEEDVEKKVSMKYAKLISERDAQINDLAKQVESLKSINSGLELKMKNMVLDPENPVSNKLNELSQAKVNEFVDQLLSDANVNIKYLPDFVERAIYKNVLNLIIALLNNIFNTVSIKFFGHNLTFNIMPDQTIVANNENTGSTIVMASEVNVKNRELFLEEKPVEDTPTLQFPIDEKEIDAILTPEVIANNDQNTN